MDLHPRDLVRHEPVKPRAKLRSGRNIVVGSASGTQLPQCRAVNDFVVPAVINTNGLLKCIGDFWRQGWSDFRRLTHPHHHEKTYKTWKNIQN
eukprot:6212522-Pleurochrysis_carterae.AAC.3